MLRLATRGIKIRENKQESSTEVATLSGWNFIKDETTIVFAAIGALASKSNAWCSGVSYHFNTNLSKKIKAYVTAGNITNLEKKEAIVNFISISKFFNFERPSPIIIIPRIEYAPLMLKIKSSQKSGNVKPSILHTHPRANACSIGRRKICFILSCVELIDLAQI